MSDERAPADPLVLMRRLVRRWWPLATGLTAVLVVLLIVFRHHFSWGDLPTWLMAITALTAFAAAVFAGVVAYSLLSIEDERDSRARLDQAKEQANQVAAWVRYHEPGEAGEKYNPAESVAFMVVRNVSNLPVYHATLSISSPDPPEPGVYWSGSSGEWGTVFQVPMLPPGEEQLNLPRPVWETTNEAGRRRRLEIAIEFTDAAGVTWLRDPRGRLNRL